MADTTRWEYTTVDLVLGPGPPADFTDLMKMVNELGAAGWEAVGQITTAKGLASYPSLLLKRPVI